MDLTSFERMKLADEQDMGLRFMRWLGVLRRAHVRQGEVGSADGSRLTFSTEQLAALESLYLQRKVAAAGCATRMDHFVEFSIAATNYICNSTVKNFSINIYLPKSIKLLH